MSLLLKISLRNLIRQRRRNILLGIAIAFGMTILVVANSFSHGISDIMFNKIIVYMTGHIDLNMMENGRFRTPINRDLARFEGLISQNIKGIVKVEENLSVMGRGVGNGKSDLIMIVGVDIANKEDKDFKNYFALQEGSFEDYKNVSNKYQNPIMITAGKAKALNVKLHDKVSVRIQNIYGQQQTAMLTIVAIIKSKNLYLDMALYLKKSDTKRLMGLKEHETGSLQIVLKEPKSSILQADRLHSLLTPNIACFYGRISADSQETLVVSYKRNAADIAFLNKSISLLGTTNMMDKEVVLVNKKMADTLNIKKGQTLEFVYAHKFDTQNTSLTLVVDGLFDSKTTSLPANTLILGDDLFFKNYYVNLPANLELSSKIFDISPHNLMYIALGKEYELLKRSRTSKEMTKKIKDLSGLKHGSALLDIRTMYETASAIVKMESALNLITFLAVLVLFFIILIGVVNTLRMTIKERTREIGTLRAIGMQKAEVRNSFVLETFLLTLMSTLAGIIMAFGLMGLLGMLIFNTESTFSILLVDKHLHFVPRIFPILLNMILIIVIALITAYIPANNAANMNCSEALRHHE